MTSQHPKTIPTKYLWRLSIPRYHAMIATGLFTEMTPIPLNINNHTIGHITLTDLIS